MNQKIYGRLIALALLLSMGQPLTAQPTFNKPHGLMKSPFLFRITASGQGNEIRYTTDGSEPQADSELFRVSFMVSATTIVRAAEFQAGERVSPISTVSYIFPTSVLSQAEAPSGYPEKWGSLAADYGMDPELTGNATLAKKITQGFYDLPVLSLVTDRGNLFNSVKDPEYGGIYIYTGTSESNGRGWERPVSVELMGGPQQHDLSTTCALKMHGGQGRVPEKNPKHSFRLTFKDEYGPGKLHYPLFGEDYVSEFNSLIVRTFYNFSWIHSDATQRSRAQYTRDMWARKMQKRMGHQTSDGVYVHLFINGLYWGLYNLAERIDDEYCKNHFGGKKSQYDVIKREDSALDVAEGTGDRWAQLLRLAEHGAEDKYYRMIIGLDPLSEGKAPETYLDVDNLIDYMLINQYAGNDDWDHHNWIAVCNRERSNEGFRFICWDSENTFNNPQNNVLGLNNKECPSYVFSHLMNNPTFRHRYIDRAYRFLSSEGQLSPQSTVELWDSLYYTISGAIYDESARWGDYRRDVHPYTSKGELYLVDNQYQTERKRLLESFFPTRTNLLVQQLKSKGWYSNTDPPRFQVNGHEVLGDTLQLTDRLTLAGAAGLTVYYTTDGTDPVAWKTFTSGTPTESASSYKGNLVPEGLEAHAGQWLTVRVIAKSGSNWSPVIHRRFFVAPVTGVMAVPDTETPLHRGIYNMQGQQVQRAGKGLYIIGGRKVLMH